MKFIKKKWLYSGFVAAIIIFPIIFPFTSWPSTSLIDDATFFKLLDKDNPDLSEIIAAANKGDIDTAADLWKEYFINRNWTAHGEPLEADVDSVSKSNSFMKHTNHWTGEYKMMYGRQWKDINWHDNPNPSESEAIYTFNRFYFATNLAKAYLYNGNDSYAWEFFCCVTDWIQDEPLGANGWATRTLDTMRRFDGWFRPFIVFMHTEYCTSRFVLDFCKSIIDQARFVRDLHGNENNWMVHESKAMIYARGFLPEIKESITWESEGWESLENFAREDVHPDGGATESSSTGYHGGSLDSLTEAFEMAEHFPYITPSNYLKQTIAKMAYFSLHVKSPDFRLYNYGDAWERNPGITNVAAATPFCEESELYDELVYFNASLVPSGKGVMPKTHIGFPDSGYFITRTNWSTDALSSIISAGPYGTGHWHQDALSMQLYAYGKRFLIDPGTYSYGSSTTIPGHHRSSWAHSLFIMDDKAHSGVGVDSFTWAAGTYGTAASGTHSYWEADARRELVFASRGYWLVNDFWEGTGSHSVDLLYQLTDFTNITDINDQVVSTTFNSTTDSNLKMGFYSPWDTRDSIYGGEGTGDRIDWAKISHKTYKWTAGRIIILEANLNGPSCWSTVLFPVTANNTFDPTFTPLPITAGGITTLHNETFNTPGTAMAVMTPEGLDIHISLKNSQTIQINTPGFPSIEFIGKQCVIQFNSTMGVETIFSSDLNSLVVDNETIITKTDSLISSTIDRFTIGSDSVIPIQVNGVTETNVIYDENALTIGGYAL